MHTLKAAWVALVLASPVAICPQASGAPLVYRVDHVVDGDTMALRNGQRVRLVQIDTPEVFFGTECYGRAASAQTKARPLESVPTYAVRSVPRHPNRTRIEGSYEPSGQPR
jgi:hypothetical protein